MKSIITYHRTNVTLQNTWRSHRQVGPLMFTLVFQKYPSRTVTSERCVAVGLRLDWMYGMDEIETTDTGSYTPSEVETIVPWKKWGKGAASRCFNLRN